MDDILDRLEIEDSDHIYRPVKVSERVPDCPGVYFVVTEPYGISSMATRSEILRNPQNYISWLEIVPRSII